MGAGILRKVCVAAFSFLSIFGVLKVYHFENTIKSSERMEIEKYNVALSLSKELDSRKKQAIESGINLSTEERMSYYNPETKQTIILTSDDLIIIDQP